MSQRVNITYSVDVEELPQEVRKLIAKETQRHGDIAQSLQSIIEGNILSTLSIEHIDVVRRELAKIDTTLLDASAIIEGYLNYESKSTQASSSVEEAMEAPIEPPLATLIDEFRDSLGKLHEDAPSQQA